MEFPALTQALASKSYEKIADICDHLMLQVAAEGVNFQDHWPFTIHLLGHIYVNDINSARFLWKSIPSDIKESQPEVVAAWSIGQKLWTRDYAGVYESIRGFQWSQEALDLVNSYSELYTKRMFQLLVSAYSTISIQDTARFLGMNEEDATYFYLFGLKSSCLDGESFCFHGVDLSSCLLLACIDERSFHSLKN